MGSAVSAVTGALGGIGSTAGGLAGAPIQGLTQGMTPQIKAADQGKLNDQIAALQSQQGGYNNNYNNATGQVQSANGTTQDALHLLQTQANGTAPSAAQGMLQQGTDQAIATQQAMANSGNLSQMIGGQKTAMDNAANLTQQSANQASQLRANQQATGQANYAAAANANLGTNVNNALGQGNLATGAATNAGNLAAGGLGVSQGINTGNAQNQVGMTGGLMNGAGAAAMMMSDEDTKQNIQSDRSSRSKGISNYFKKENAPAKEESAPSHSASVSDYGDESPSQKKARQIKEGFMSDEDTKTEIKQGKGRDSLLHKFLEKLESVTYEYKEPDGEMGKTPGTHMGIIAQDVEKAPGGKSMVIETPEGKAIDMASAMGMLMSAAADAHDRVSSLEELFKSKKKGK